MGSFDDAVKIWNGTVLRWREESCVNLRARSIRCEACVEACPVAALELTEDKVGVTEVCTSCGGCIPVCPGGVFSVTGYSVSAVVDAVGDDAEVRLHCSESRGMGGGGIVVPCLHVVDARMLSAMAGEGVEKIYFGGLEHCEDCKRGDARETVSHACKRMEKWLGDQAPAIAAVLEDDQKRTTSAVDRHDQVKMDRRSFLRFAGVRAAASAAGWVAPQAEPIEQNVSIFDRNPFAPRPVEYLSIVADRADSIPWAEKARPPLYSRTLESACTVCEVCAQRCPTGALRLGEDSSGKAISYDADLCTNCTLCAVICPHDAVQARAFKVEDLVGRARLDLVRLETAACRQCGTRFVPEQGGNEHLCQTCLIEDELDDEWMDMMRG